jgi:hypothetical protein
VEQKATAPSASSSVQSNAFGAPRPAPLGVPEAGASKKFETAAKPVTAGSFIPSASPAAQQKSAPSSAPTLGDIPTNKPNSSAISSGAAKSVEPPKPTTINAPALNGKPKLDNSSVQSQPKLAQPVKLESFSSSSVNPSSIPAPAKDNVNLQKSKSIESQKGLPNGIKDSKEPLKEVKEKQQLEQQQAVKEKANQPLTREADGKEKVGPSKKRTSTAALAADKPQPSRHSTRNRSAVKLPVVEAPIAGEKKAIEFEKVPLLFLMRFFNTLH